MAPAALKFMQRQMWSVGASLYLPFCCQAQLKAPAQPSQADVESVVVSAPPQRAAQIAADLQEKSTPKTLLSQDVIKTIASPFADFGALLNLSPSFVSSAPNGIGFDAAKNMTLRGFPDGQFNVTLDGIPFADPDNFGHHSTSVFPAATIQRLQVDRSPGSGTTLGHSTIGGSVDISSLELPAAEETTGYGALGSFSTSQLGVRWSSGAPAQERSVGWLVNFEHAQSAGAMANAAGRKDDALLKGESVFGATRVTALYAMNRYRFYNPPSVTTSQIAALGSGAGFNNDPGTLAFKGYADTDRSADFGYVRIRAAVADHWTVDEKIYTYSYANRGLGLSGDFTKSSVGSGYGVPSTDIAGRDSNNRYRTYGNIIDFKNVSDAGTFQGGLWLEHSRQVYSRRAVDLTSGTEYNANRNEGSPVLFDYTATLDAAQPFTQYDMRLGDSLSLKPGLRYKLIRRGFDAAVVPNSLPGTGGVVRRTVSSLLPSLESRYAIDATTAAYAQWAKGSLVPSQSFFYTRAPGLGNQAQPQSSQAVQFGVERRTADMAISADIYQINVDNYISSVTVGGNQAYINNGKVLYRGIELEGHWTLGGGFTAVGNASRIQAQFQTSGVTSPAQAAGDDLPLTPSYVGLVGVLYQAGGLRASLLTKFVGNEYQGKSGSSDGPNFLVGGYKYTDFSISQSFGSVAGVGVMTGRLLVNNVFNQSPITDTAGPSALGPLLVNVLPRRSFMLALSATL